MRAAILLLSVCLCTAAELPAGSYTCLYAPVDGAPKEAAMTLSRDADGTITVRADGHPESFAGRQVGDKLYLVHQRIDSKGLEVLQIIATVGPDGYAAGSAWRSLDAESVQKSNFILKQAK